MTLFDLSKASPGAKKFLVIFYLSLQLLVTWLGIKILLDDLLIGLLVLIGGNLILAKDNLPLVINLLTKTKNEYKKDYEELIKIPNDSYIVKALMVSAIILLISFLIIVFT